MSAKKSTSLLQKTELFAKMAEQSLRSQAQQVETQPAAQPRSTPTPQSLAPRRPGQDAAPLSVGDQTAQVAKGNNIRDLINRYIAKSLVVIDTPMIDWYRVKANLGKPGSVPVQISWKKGPGQSQTTIAELNRAVNDPKFQSWVEKNSGAKADWLKTLKFEFGGANQMDPKDIK